MSIGEQFSKFIMETNLGDIPPETIRFTKELALKTVAGMLAGSVMLAGRKITNLQAMLEQIGRKRLRVVKRWTSSV